jgi:hypothetical protein
MARAIRQVIASEKNTRKQKCFIISPIGEHNSPVRREADAVKQLVIERALKIYAEASKQEVDAQRSDEKFEAGRVPDQVLRHILEDDLIIAVLPHHNPNVYYELAIAHAAGRPVIMLKRDDYKLPFDIQDQRATVTYEYDPVSLASGKAAQQLADVILNVVRRQDKYLPPFEQKDWSPLGGNYLHFRYYPNFSDIKLEEFGGLISEANKFIVIAEPWLEVMYSQPTNSNNIKWKIGDNVWEDVPLLVALKRKQDAGCQIIVMMLDPDNSAAAAVYTAPEEALARPDTGIDPEETTTPVGRPLRLLDELPEAHKRLMADRLATFKVASGEGFRVQSLRRGLLHTHVIMNERGGVVFPRAYLTHAWGRSSCIKISDHSPFYDVILSELKFLFGQNGGTGFPDYGPVANEPAASKGTVVQSMPILQQCCDVVAEAKQFVYIAEPDFDLLRNVVSPAGGEEVLMRVALSQAITTAASNRLPVTLFVMEADHPDLARTVDRGSETETDVELTAFEYRRNFDYWSKTVTQYLLRDAVKGRTGRLTGTLSIAVVNQLLTIRIVLTEKEAIIIPAQLRLSAAESPGVTRVANGHEFYSTTLAILRAMEKIKRSAAE